MKFFYKAKDKSGSVKTGRIEAGSLDAALKILQGYELIVLDLNPERKMTFFDSLFGKSAAISKKDLVIFLRQFATLFQSQVPLTEALKTLLLQAATPAVKDLILGLVADLDAGFPLSRALERRSDVFGEYYSQMMKSGEMSGRLDEVLNYLADYAEHENDLMNKAKSSAAYPVFLLLAFMGIGTVITVALAPQMAAIFDEFGRTPPLSTKILIFIGTFLSRWGLLLLIFLLGMAWLLINYFRSKEGRKVGGIYLLKIPIIGNIYKKIFISRFAETVANLILGGIPAIAAFETAGNATGNYIYQKIGDEIVRQLRTGVNISDVLKNYYEYFPPLVSQMAAVGESTGRLEQILKKVAEYYTKEVDRAFSVMIDLLQPILVILIGVLVGFLVTAVLLPIYQLAQGI